MAKVTVTDPGPRPTPTVGTIRCGAMFKLVDDSSVVYMKGARQARNEIDCMHLGTGAIYGIDFNKPIIPVYGVVLED